MEKLEVSGRLKDLITFNHNINLPIDLTRFDGDEIIMKVVSINLYNFKRQFAIAVGGTSVFNNPLDLCAGALLAGHITDYTDFGFYIDLEGINLPESHQIEDNTNPYYYFGFLTADSSSLKSRIFTNEVPTDNQVINIALSNEFNIYQGSLSNVAKISINGGLSSISGITIPYNKITNTGGSGLNTRNISFTFTDDRGLIMKDSYGPESYISILVSVEPTNVL